MIGAFETQIAQLRRMKDLISIYNKTINYTNMYEVIKNNHVLLIDDIYEKSCKNARNCVIS